MIETLTGMVSTRFGQFSGLFLRQGEFYIFDGSKIDIPLFEDEFVTYSFQEVLQ